MSDNEKPVELKPCPFCGGKAILEYACGEYWVACENKCDHLQTDIEKVIATWNSRTSANVIKQFEDRIAELEAQVKAMRNHQNCKYGDTMGSNEHCLNGCMCSKDLPNWEPKEAK